MKIRESGKPVPLWHSVSVKITGPDGTVRTEERLLAAEYSFTLRVSGGPSLPLTCTPSHLPEFVLGRLLTENLIRSADDVLELAIDTAQCLADVLLRDFSKDCGSSPDSGSREIPGGSSGKSSGGSGKSPGGSSGKCPGTAPASGQPLSPDTEQILRLSSILDLPSGAPDSLYRLTRSAHSCSLIYRGKSVFTAEDLGRHNAVDKAVGHALLKNIPLPECMLYTTGRMPADMVTKAARAGVPVLISRKSPTAEGLLLAEKHGVRLFGITRDGCVLSYGRETPLS